MKQSRSRVISKPHPTTISNVLSSLARQRVPSVGHPASRTSKVIGLPYRYTRAN